MPSALEYERDGAQLFEGAALSSLKRLSAAFDYLPRGRAGARLSDLSFASELFDANGSIGRAAASAAGSKARPVRAIAFDKTDDSNWSLDWHQDRTICVEARIDTPGFDPWTTKSGLLHVAPPFEVLRGMVTIRLHLDQVDQDNAPLLIALGSHRLGRIPETEIAQTVARSEIAVCLADAGDVWLYATPILHASKAADRPSRRRVLQVDYAGFDLPNGLRWRTLI